MYNHGIVAGKFWPLHLGHDYLIRTALSNCHRLTILAIFKSGEIPDIDIRIQWLREAYPTANVVKACNLFTDDTTHESNVEWAAYTNVLLNGDMPDVVFSSEDYAKGWASEMGAKHVMVDQARSFYAISGTEIRHDPYAYFHLIHPAARPFYVKKVLLVGAESVGKTTLAKNLAKAYSTVFVPEYGRIYVERYGITEAVKKDIFPAIVNQQPAMEDEFIKQANRVLFCDTDLWTTSIWYEAWQPDNVGDALHQTIMDEANKRQPTYDLVLLSDHEGTQWVDDGHRDQGHRREWFSESLQSVYSNCNLVTLSGDWDERWCTAVEAINNHLFRSTLAVLPSYRYERVLGGNE